jgi:hypothetical protein
MGSDHVEHGARRLSSGCRCALPDSVVGDVCAQACRHLHSVPALIVRPVGIQNRMKHTAGERRRRSLASAHYSKSLIRTDLLRVVYGSVRLRIISTDLPSPNRRFVQPLSTHLPNPTPYPPNRTSHRHSPDSQLLFHLSTHQIS